MAQGTITAQESVAAVGPMFVDRISFPGDSAYPAGGTAGFQAAVQAKIGANRNIIAVIPQDCGGFHAAYNHTTDKLKVYWAHAAAADDEVTATTDLSATTFNLVVLSY